MLPFVLPALGRFARDPVEEWESAQRYWATHKHCRYCGREMVDSIERDTLADLLAAGHGRRALVLADQEAGAEPPEGVVVDDEGRWTIPVVHGWSSKNDAELLAYVIADNQHTMSPGWNPALLVSGLQEITTAGADLDGVGISRDDLDDLIASLGPVPSVDDLQQREGESEPSDFWPTLSVKLSPALAERWQAAKARAETEDDAAVLAWVLEQTTVPA